MDETKELQADIPEIHVHSHMHVESCALYTCTCTHHTQQVTEEILHIHCIIISRKYQTG